MSTSSSRILIIEDEFALAEIVVDYLAREGFTCIHHTTGFHCVETIKTENIDLVLLDVMLPDLDGFEVCKMIRKTLSTPIIMVTARSEAEDMEEAFLAGADDYFEKSPWQPERLMARINNSLRVPKPIETDADVLKIGSITLDIVGHEVRRGDEKIALTPLEFKLLSTLAEKPKMVFSREQLLKDVWDYPYQGDTRLVNVHIQRLRSKIEDDPDDPKIVVTVRGIGYKAGLN